jgi:hypothetical protein
MVAPGVDVDIDTVCGAVYEPAPGLKSGADARSV